MHYLMFLWIAILLPAEGLAQEVVPKIDHTIPETAIAGEPLRFTVTVSAAENLVALDLYYRQPGEDTFTQLPMTTVDGSEYTATVPGMAVQGDELEYYIEALDRYGNLTVRGGKRFPLLVSIQPRPSPAVTAQTPASLPPDPPAPKSSTAWKWILGALAVGAIAALAGGDDGGNDSASGAAPPPSSTALTFTDAPAP